MAKKLETEVKVGLFVTIGVGLVMLAILVLGSSQNLLMRQNHYHISFKNAEGLIPGAKVVLGGIQVGTVDALDFSHDRSGIRVHVAVATKYADFIRKDSAAEIATQGVLGDKFITISTGTQEQPQLEDGGELTPRPSKDISQFINKGDQLMLTLNTLAGSLDRLVKTFEEQNRAETFFQGMATSAKNLSSATDKLNRELDGMQLKSTVRNLNQILEKVNNGTGTLGALINDPALYDDAKKLMGGANRNRIVRNLVRQTIKESSEKEAEQGEKKQ